MKAIIATLILTLISTFTSAQTFEATFVDGTEYSNSSNIIDVYDSYTGLDTFFVYSHSTYQFFYEETSLGTSLYTISGSSVFSYDDTNTTDFITTIEIDFSLVPVDSSYILDFQFPGNGNLRCVIKVIDDTNLGINETFKEDVQLSVFPNPVVDYVTVRFNTENNDVPVYVYTLGGQLVYTDNASRYTGANVVTVDFSSFNTGIYLVKVGGSTFKVIKN